MLKAIGCALLAGFSRTVFGAVIETTHSADGRTTVEQLVFSVVDSPNKHLYGMALMAVGFLVMVGPILFGESKKDKKRRGGELEA